MRALALLRSILGIVFLIPWTVLYSVITIVLGNVNQFARADRYVRYWARKLLDAFGVHVKLHGVENIPTDRGVLFIFNHQSHFDILALKAHVPRVLSFGAKAELFKIPFFGPAMRALGTLPIERGNRAEVFRVYQKAQERFSSTLNFILAPEGTRQSKPEIGIFKKGPFIFAINGQVPIVPVVIAGAYEILPKHSLIPNSRRLSRTVHMEFLPPLETQGLTAQDAATIRDEAYSQVLRTFTKLQPLIEPL